MKTIAELEQQLGYQFRDKSLIETALTHTSYAYEKGVGSYERMEYLGDAVLEMLISELLYESHTALSEGEMTRLRACVVCEGTLAAVALEAGLDSYIRLGHGEEQTGGRKRPSIIADVFESVLAAVYLDGGIEPSRTLVRRALAPKIEEAVLQEVYVDYKTRLQELLQAQSREKIEYHLLESSGPVHDCTFVMNVTHGDRVLGEGRGKSKKEAQKAAAAAALRALSAKDAAAGREKV